MLAAWEWAASATSLRRPLVLLDVLTSSETDFNWLELSIGQRNRRLLELRETLFGPLLHCTTPCPECKNELEFEITTEDLNIEAPPSQDEYQVTHDEKVISFRLPTTSDLEFVSKNDCVSSARTALLTRCLLSDVEDESQTDFVIEEMEAVDPVAIMRLSLLCPSCDHEWVDEFDIASYLWTELTYWAQRHLDEVHTLASHYGWSEQAIMSLGRGRRRAYLNRIEA